MLTTQTNGSRYFIELAFNGTGFHGWQIQPAADTVQEILNFAITTLTGESVNLAGCGRTDAGVHASHFVAHFDVKIPIADCNLLVYRLNRFINKSIRIDRIVPVNADSHARFHAISRTYHYLIAHGKAPFMKDFSWDLSIPIDIDAMNLACRVLTGKHDFTSFSKLHSDVKTNDCEVFEASWSEHSGFLIFRIRADRFLRNMVRAIVGTLIEVGKGKIAPADVEKILLAKDRSSAGMSVPAKGLYLTKVEYPAEIFRIDPKSPFTDWIYNP
ncbi:MAG: tRNA pseudouridine(38-40) synthase TruA [Bacteroidia bacterium]|nr:tRNA pseudouridine(38-40) synthase TruA [Bacteroidia bacterium]